MDLSQAQHAEEFFSPEEKERIREAVVQAEKRTSGEIATVIVWASDRYREAEALGALLLAGLVAVVAAVAIRHVTIWSYIPLVFLLFYPALKLFHRFPRLKLSFAAAGRVADAVSERALVAFYQQGLYRTKEETGILIFISLLERKVWILGDRGIGQKIPQVEWNNLVEQLAQGLRQGKAADSLCQVIASCGIELAKHFPRRRDDQNELPDEIIAS
ncbi:TPM domain-containing protein [Citrifermentans bremense]|uniref:TPM domain-containing protein n=1 Tax=Citrifermentans bremense TaxID=60035 RepID=UPI000406C7BF|nr:TPM domain-containing protein [Citrifermentans bremense]